MSYNRNGIYKAVVKVNGEEKFSYTFDKIDFRDGKKIEALIDYPTYREERIRIQKLFRDLDVDYSFLPKTAPNGFVDFEKDRAYQIEIVVEVTPGELSRIILPESGTRVTSDGVLDLLPLFEDEYGNRLYGISVNWVVDDNDITTEIRLADNKWAPSKLGMHEIRAMAQGVFAITNIEVVAGIARHIATDYDEGIAVASGYDIDITISTLDVHGNIALASSVDFEFDDPEGVITPSSKGDGIWTVEGLSLIHI